MSISKKIDELSRVCEEKNFKVNFNAQPKKLSIIIFSDEAVIIKVKSDKEGCVDMIDNVINTVSNTPLDKLIADYEYKKSRFKTLRLDMIDLHDYAKNLHPQNAMDNLGIIYEDCEPVTIADCWIFYGCDNVPDVLPKYLQEVSK